MSHKTIPVLPKALLLSIESIYDPCNFSCTDIEAEPESADYGACSLRIEGKPVRFREAKITPTKTGQFVTLWKRSEAGPIAPFDLTDDLDLVIVCTLSNDRFGQFVFPKAVLLEKGIFSTGKKEGKRAIRVYPPWDIAANKQAQQTQRWQLDYFLEIPKGGSVDRQRINQLFGA